MLVDTSSPTYIEVRDFLLTLDMPITSFCEQVDVSRPTIYRIFSGKPVQIETIEAIKSYKKEEKKTYDIRKLRQLSNLTQVQVCEILDISQSTLSRLESSGVLSDSPHYEKYKEFYDYINENIIADEAFITKELWGVSTPLIFRELRRHANLSQRKMALKLGVSQPFISQIETGERNLSTYQLIQFFNIFKLSVISILELIDKVRIICNNGKTTTG